MAVINEGYEMVPVSALKPHPRNARKGDVGAIVESIGHNGFFGALVVQKSTSHILAGNHRYLAAKAEHMSQVPVIWVDVDDQQALKILLADNRTNDIASYDDTALAELLAELSNTVGLEGTGYSSDDLDELIGLLADEGGNTIGEAPEAQLDKAEELREKWGVEYGQLWEVGRHRILCGDSTKAEDVAKVLSGSYPLVLTDPPYGIDVVQGKTVGGDGPPKFKGSVGGSNVVAATAYLPVKNDESTDTARLFIEACKENGIVRFIVWGGNYFTDFLFPSRCWLIWDKENTGNFADAELAWTSFDKGVKLYKWMWNGMARKGDRSTEGVKRFHPTQKPVGLHVDIIKDYAEPKEVIFDGFLGSGTTAVACEQAGHSCCAIEWEPLYVAVTLQRLADMGLEPRLIDASGQTNQANT